MTDICKAFMALPLGNICDANGKGGNMDAEIKPIDPACKMAGPAFTVKGHPGDNFAIHRAIYEAPAGAVLVVDVAGYRAAGHFGEIMATACMRRGIAGLVIDGGVRDADDMQALGFPVFCRAVNPGGTQKEVVGSLGQDIVCGSLPVHTGDMIVGGRDGVVVVRHSEIESVLEAAQAIAAREVDVLKQLEAGKSTIEIYQFPKFTHSNG